jgi:hypothetical protein
VERASERKLTYMTHTHFKLTHTHTAGLWGEALRLLYEEESCSSPTRAMYTGALVACAAAGRWAEAKNLVAAMGGRG